MTVRNDTTHSWTGQLSFTIAGTSQQFDNLNTDIHRATTKYWLSGGNAAGAALIAGHFNTTTGAATGAYATCDNNGTLTLTHASGVASGAALVNYLAVGGGKTVT
jgi:hypothetical protein